MPDAKVVHRKQSGGAISTGNRRVKTTVKCASISPRGGPLLLSWGRLGGVWEQPPKGFYQTWVLYRNVSTKSILERTCFLTKGNCTRKYNETNCKSSSWVGVETGRNVLGSSAWGTTSTIMKRSIDWRNIERANASRNTPLKNAPIHYT